MLEEGLEEDQRAMIMTLTILISKCSNDLVA